MEITISIKDGTEEKTYVITGSCRRQTRVFGKNNQYYDSSLEANRMFLLVRERYANDLLKHKGRVFLNEIYDMLGFSRTHFGNLVGWADDDKIEFTLETHKDDDGTDIFIVIFNETRFILDVLEEET